MNLLFITKIQPLPVDGGEKIRSFGLLYCLQKLGHDVTVITPGSNLSDPDARFIDKVKFIFHRFNLLSLAVPFVRDRRLIKAVQEQHAKKAIDLAILDYQYLGQYIGWFRRRGIPVIYGTHNAQAHLDFQRVSQRPFQMKLPQLIYAGAVWLHERFYFNRANLLWVTSEEDAAYHRKFIGAKKIVELPNFLITEKYSTPMESEKGDYIVITANFNSFQNTAGAEWFFRTVWNAELAQMTRLLLVGNKSDILLNRLQQEKGFYTEHVEATGLVESVNGFVSNARLSLVPLLHGSGTRLKIIEALALKTPVISTSIGAAGIQEGIVRIADDPLEFKTAVRQILSEQSTATEFAYQAFVEKYSSESAMKIIGRSLDQIIGDH